MTNPIEMIRRELALFGGLQRTLKAYQGLEPGGALSVADDLERSADRFADRVAFRFEGQSLTYAALDARANAYANWAVSIGLKTGDCIALMMTNRPDFVACWAGLAKIGVATALINTNLGGAALAHCIAIVNARNVIASSDLRDAAQSAIPHLNDPPQLWIAGESGDLEDNLAAAGAVRPDPALRASLKSSDTALYVYTSGTTGAPKAARMTHLRVLGMLRAFIGGGRAAPSDRVYIALPLYHATGGLTGVGFALESGATIVLRQKFSASHFWEEINAEKATVFFYIGELCRYLLNAPEHPLERKHVLRLAVGNGMRPDVWGRFKQRFKIPRVLEFYGSTEGNVTLLNFDGKVGAIGRIPGWLKSRINIRVVKFDVETEAPLRGPDGLCIEADIGEAGEALGKINANDPRSQFQGYTGDPKQTERKIVRDVFEQGDAWFRTGDLMRRDGDDYFYFVDRVGDTFRWKGENVSTNEVGDIISAVPGVEEANVYGVAVAGADGRAGMAAILPGAGFDLAALHKTVTAALPSYARPMFVRVKSEIETTGTFKYRKVDLISDGFDPGKTSDPLYFDAGGAYAPLTPALYTEIQSGARRL